MLQVQQFKISINVNFSQTQAIYRINRLCIAMFATRLLLMGRLSSIAKSVFSLDLMCVANATHLICMTNIRNISNAEFIHRITHTKIMLQVCVTNNTLLWICTVSKVQTLFSQGLTTLSWLLFMHCAHLLLMLQVRHS